MTCLPYKDSVMISAQVLSIVGFFLSIVSFGFFPGLVTFIMLQVVWCCSMNKCGLITAGVFAIIASIVSIIDGILLLVSTNAASYTFIYSSTTTTCINQFNGVTYDCSGANDGAYTITTNDGPFVGVAAVSFIGAACWIATAVCVFIFVKSGRYEQFIESQFDDKNDIVVPSATIDSPPTTTSATIATTTKPAPEVRPPSPETTQIEYIENLEDDIESPSRQ